MRFDRSPNLGQSVDGGDMARASNVFLPTAKRLPLLCLSERRSAGWSVSMRTGVCSEPSLLGAGNYP